MQQRALASARPAEATAAYAAAAAPQLSASETATETVIDVRATSASTIAPTTTLTMTMTAPTLEEMAWEAMTLTATGNMVWMAQGDAIVKQTGISHLRGG